MTFLPLLSKVTKGFSVFHINFESFVREQVHTQRDEKTETSPPNFNCLALFVYMPSNINVQHLVFNGNEFQLKRS